MGAPLRRQEEGEEEWEEEGTTTEWIPPRAVWPTSPSRSRSAPPPPRRSLHCHARPRPCLHPARFILPLPPSPSPCFPLPQLHPLTHTSHLPTFSSPPHPPHPSHTGPWRRLLPALLHHPHQGGTVAPLKDPRRLIPSSPLPNLPGSRRRGKPSRPPALPSTLPPPVFFMRGGTLCLLVRIPGSLLACAFSCLHLHL